MEKYEEFQDIIGYQFKNIRFLKRALTHSSYVNERHLKKNTSNERLEFLGDAVLEVVSSEFLFINYPELAEGDLTKLRASLVCEPTLADCTPQIRLGEFLLMGRGEENTGGRERKSILSDALEAVIGGIYLDGGFTNAKEFILKFILTDIEHKQLFYDSKTILQELIQAKHQGQLSYVLLDEQGPDHNKSFSVEVKMGEQVIGSGMGHTKKAAEQQAAYKALMALKEKEPVKKKGSQKTYVSKKH